MKGEQIGKRDDSMISQTDSSVGFQRHYPTPEMLERFSNQGARIQRSVARLDRFNKPPRRFLDTEITF